MRRGPPAEWEPTFKKADQSIILGCQSIDERGNGFIPPVEKVFAAYDFTKPRQTKVVIVGQDVYPTNPSGLAFSSNIGIPKSLAVIYKELERTVPGFVAPNHGVLESWCGDNGVMLLNIGLTADPGVSGKQMGSWKGLLSCTVETLSPYRPIYMLWGGVAQKAMNNIFKGTVNESDILSCPHPSPVNTGGGFAGCDHFMEANRRLAARGISPVNWHLPLEIAPTALEL